MIALAIAGASLGALAPVAAQAQPQGYYWHHHRWHHRRPYWHHHHRYYRYYN